MSQSFSPAMPKTVAPARPGPGRSGRAGSVARWPLYRNPLRLAVSASPWRSAWYLLGRASGGAVFVALAHVARGWRDPAAWRELGRAAGLWLPLGALDAVVLSVWGWFVAMITLPAWYWAPWMDVHGQRFHGYQLGFWFPHGPSGPGTVGVFIDTLPKALLAAAIGLAGFIAGNYVLVATARANAR
jgi:hypothetical protein